MASFTVGDVARDSGVSSSAVRFYEARGLITAIRTSGNQRRFDDHAACRVRVAQVAQRIGLSINEIATLLGTLGPSPTFDDWKRLHTELTTEAHRRIAELHQTLDDISSHRKLCEL
ncbi:MerR family DNA-binding transcriptional regulator [Micromonospora sp. NPDC085948]|uniref:MerR family DNA-binding transcriptional regulator n=1 Tax=Micromonospora sp. NPDC085948 TaxID=3155293 RepID=UPI00343530DB